MKKLRERMRVGFQADAREFLRLKVAIRVSYRFVPAHSRPEGEMERVYEGETVNLSGGGMLLYGSLPRIEWIPDLLMEKIHLAVELSLEGEEPVRAIARVAWIDSEAINGGPCEMGLKFKEITQAGQDRILDFIIRRQLA